MSIRKVINKYHIWDARRILELVPNEEFVDVTITSPPYWNLKNYEVESQIGYGQSYDDYLADLEKVFEAVYTITKPKGSLWIISDTIKHNGNIVLLPFELAQRLKNVGWNLQDIIIWQKDRTLPWSHQGKLRNIFEYIAFYSKGSKFNYYRDRVREVDQLKEWWVRYPERYSPEGKAPSRIWWIPIPRQGSWGESNNWVRHFNPFPPDLVKRILLLTTNKGAVVLDPFCGSGIVLAQAHVMERRYIGLDLNKGYRERFVKQVMPAIRKIHKHSLKATHKSQQEKRTFGKKILSLRKTKYPKELVRLFTKTYGPEDPDKLEAIFAIQGQKRDTLNIIFCFGSSYQIGDDFIDLATAVAKRPPLSKYSLTPHLSAYSVEGIHKRWFKRLGLEDETPVYIYANGRTYTWAHKASLGECLQQLKNGKRLKSLQHKYPPIISDITVKVSFNSPQQVGEKGNDAE